MKWATTILVFCVAALLGLGLVMLYSASVNIEVHSAQVGSRYLVAQLVWCVVGLIACAVVASIDYRRLKKLSPFLLGFAVLLLLLVFIPHIGIQSHGARRWIGKFGIRFQPSEMAKIALIVFLAYYGE